MTQSHNPFPDLPVRRYSVTAAMTDMEMALASNPVRLLRGLMVTKHEREAASKRAVRVSRYLFRTIQRDPRTGTVRWELSATYIEPEYPTINPSLFGGPPW